MSLSRGTRNRPQRKANMGSAVLYYGSAIILGLLAGWTIWRAWFRG